MKSITQVPMNHVARVFDVIDSCQTADQLLVARQYYLLWLRRYRGGERAFFGMAFSEYALDKCKLLELQERAREKTPDHHPET